MQTMVDQRPVWLLTASVNRSTRELSVQRSGILTRVPILPGRDRAECKLYRSTERAQTRFIVLRGETAETAELESVWSAPLAVGYHRVIFEVEASGAVAVLNEQGTRLTRIAHHGSVLQEYESQNGRHLPREREGGLDLLVVLDCIGTPEAFERRRALATQIVQRLAEQFEVETSLRVCIVAVADEFHTVSEPLRVDPVKCECDFVPAGKALAALAKVTPMASLDFDYPGAFERVLGDLDALHWGRPDAARVCLTMTSRPPHPDQAGPHFLIPAAAGFARWPSAYKATAQDKGIFPMLVVFPSDWTMGPQYASLAAAQAEYTQASWQTIAPENDNRWFVDETTDDEARSREITRRLLEHWKFTDRPLRLPELPPSGSSPR